MRRLRRPVRRAFVYLAIVVFGVIMVAAAMLFTQMPFPVIYIFALLICWTLCDVPGAVR